MLCVVEKCSTSNEDPGPSPKPTYLFTIRYHFGTNTENLENLSTVSELQKN